MLCDVFEDHRNDFKFGANPMPQDSIFQFYFLSVRYISLHSIIFISCPREKLPFNNKYMKNEAFYLCNKFCEAL